MAAQSTTYRNALLGPAASNGYPVRAPASWNPGDYNSVFPGLMSLQRGDEGRLEGHDPDYLKDPSGWEKDGHRVWVRVTITRRRGKLVNISGRVPKDLLQIGTERKYGEYVTELLRDTTLPSSKTTNRSLPAGDRVFQTACVLLKEFKDQQVHLGVSAASVVSLGVDDDRLPMVQVAEIFVAGLKRGLGTTYNKLLTDDFTWSDLKKASTEITIDNHAPGVYCWAHSNFEDDSTRVPAIAIGSTEDLGMRLTTHRYAYEKSLKDYNNKVIRRMPHQYEAWRLSQKHEMVALVTLDKTATDDTLRWCELLCIILFQSFHPCFYAPNQVSLDLPEATEAGRPEPEIQVDDSEVRSAMPPASGPSLSAAVTSWSSSIVMRKFGVKLASISSGVFPRTKWPGGCQRGTFGASGTNWQAPCGGFDSGGTCLTKITVPGVMDTYRKSFNSLSLKSYENTPRLLLAGLLGYILKVTFPVDEAATLGMFEGTKVYPIFEVMHRGAGNHAYPWARLAEVPEFTDEGTHNIANRLGLRLEWQYVDKTTGEVKWGKLYTHSPLVMEHAENRPAQSYTIAIAIIRCLQLQTLKSYPD